MKSLQKPKEQSAAVNWKTNTTMTKGKKDEKDKQWSTNTAYHPVVSHEWVKVRTNGKYLFVEVNKVLMATIRSVTSLLAPMLNQGYHYRNHTLYIGFNWEIYSNYTDSAGKLFHPVNQCDVIHIMTLIIKRMTSVLNVTTYISSYIQ